MYFLTLLATDDWYFVYIWVGCKKKYDILSWFSVWGEKPILIMKSDFISTHTQNLSFNSTELLFLILVITHCRRTFLPHFLAENFKWACDIRVLVPFYRLYPCMMLFHVQILSLCEGLFLCSEENNGRIYKIDWRKCSLAVLFEMWQAWHSPVLKKT